MKKSKFLNGIKIVWLVAVIAGGVYYVVKNYDTAIEYFSSIEPLELIISFVLIIALRILSIDLVQRSLVIIGWKPNFKRAFSLVSISQLGKYIPGGIWQFVARFGAYKENQISTKDMGKSFLIENIWMVGGAFFCSLAFLLISMPDTVLQDVNLQLSTLIRYLLSLVCIILWLLMLIIIERIFDQKPKRDHPKIVLKQFISQAVMWIINGISFFILLPGTEIVNGTFFSIGGFGASFLAGYVAIFAPGGLGVREYVTTVLFSLVYVNVEIGILSIVHRLLYTIAEFLLAGIAYLIPNNGQPVADSEPALTDLH